MELAALLLSKYEWEHKQEKCCVCLFMFLQIMKEVKRERNFL